MFVEQLRQAVTAAPRVELPKVSALLWKAYAAGSVTEAQASELSELIEARKAIPARAEPVQRRRVGSRPRTPESTERRRRWAASGLLPSQIQCRFTAAEAAVLAVVAVEVKRRGACTLTIGHIAALAGVSETTVRNAMREAKALGLVTIEERRRTAWMNYPNVVRVISKEWASWLRLHGCKFVKATPTVQNRRAPLWPADPVKNAAGKQQAEPESPRRESRTAPGRGP